MDPSQQKPVPPGGDVGKSPAKPTDAPLNPVELALDKFLRAPHGDLSPSLQEQFDKAYGPYFAQVRATLGEIMSKAKLELASAKRKAESELLNRGVQEGSLSALLCEQIELSQVLNLASQAAVNVLVDRGSAYVQVASNFVDLLNGQAHVNSENRFQGGVFSSWHYTEPESAALHKLVTSKNMIVEAAHTGALHYPYVLRKGESKIRAVFGESSPLAELKDNSILTVPIRYGDVPIGYILAVRPAQYPFTHQMIKDLMLISTATADGITHIKRVMERLH